MPIISNPRVRRVAVPAGDARVVLVLRNYTADEYAQFMGGRFGFRKKGKIDDRSMQARIGFVDAILIDIEAVDRDGNPDYVVYVDPKTGKEEKLTNQAEDWKEYVNPSWKISAALELEGESAEIQETAVKN